MPFLLNKDDVGTDAPAAAALDESSDPAIGEFASFVKGRGRLTVHAQDMCSICSQIVVCFAVIQPRDRSTEKVVAIEAEQRLPIVTARRHPVQRFQDFG